MNIGSVKTNGVCSERVPTEERHVDEYPLNDDVDDDNDERYHWYFMCGTLDGWTRGLQRYGLSTTSPTLRGTGT